MAELESAEAERKQTEEALRESEERYRSLIENQGEGVAIVDLEERFSFANPAAERLFDVPAGDLVGRSLKEFVEPEHLARIQEQTRVRHKGERGSYEAEIVHLDGKRRSVLLTATPQFDREGQVIGTFEIFRDITRRKQMEEALRIKDFALESSISAIGLADLDGKITYVNEAYRKLWRYDSCGMSTHRLALECQRIVEL